MANPGYTYLKEYRERRTAERYTKAVEFLGGKCNQCGTDSGLQFDHVDRNTKEYDISTHLWDYSWKRLLTELFKCQLLCQPCHFKKTLDDLGMKPAKGTHGTLSAYKWCGPPKCTECFEVHRRYYLDNRPESVKSRTIAQHGEYRKYRAGCRCNLCKKSNRDRISKYRASL